MSTHTSRHIMALDAVDLNFLQSSSLSAPTAPLWSTSALSSRTADCFYEFVVKASEASNTHDNVDSECSESLGRISDKSNPEIIYTTCYICNLKVPRAYLAEHADSAKHKAYMRIADTALVRIRKRMAVELESEDQKISTNYFCGACVSVLPIADRAEHEASATHKGSLSLDRLLNEFVALYDDTEVPGENEKEYDPSTQVNSSGISTVKVTTTTSTTTTDLNKGVEQSSASNDTEAFLDTPTRSKPKRKNEIIIDVARAADLSQYIAEIMKYDTAKHTFTVVGNEHIQIRTPDNKELVLPMEHFHGFMKIGKMHTQCKVCKDIFKNVATHICSEIHVERILLPLADSNCIRQLEESWSHCVLCNELVEKADVHILGNSEHSKRLAAALSECEPVTKQDNNYHCRTCYSTMHINSVDSHMQGSRHAANLRAAEHYLMIHVDDKIDFVCKICGTDVVKSGITVREHVESAEHLFNYNKLLAANKIIETKKDTFYCEPCGVHFSRAAEILHIERSTHKTKLASFNRIKSSDKALNTVEKVFSEKVNSNAKTANPGSSNDSKNIEKGTNNTGQEAKDVKADDHSNYHICITCNVKVPNNPYNVTTHNDGNAHRKNLEKILTEIENVPLDNNELTKQISTITAEAVLHAHMDSTDNPKELKCIVCLVRIPNKPMNIDGHINGLKHQTNFMEIMNVNMIEINNDKYTCQACKVEVKNGEEFKHIAHWKHKKIMIIEANQAEGAGSAVQGTVASQDLKAAQNGSNDSHVKTIQNVGIIANTNNSNANEQKTGEKRSDQPNSSINPEEVPSDNNSAISENDKLKNNTFRNVNEKIVSNDAIAQSDEQTATDSLPESNTARENNPTQSGSIKNDNENVASDIHDNTVQSTSAEGNDKSGTVSAPQTVADDVKDTSAGSNDSAKEKEPKSTNHHLSQEVNSKKVRCRLCDVKVPNTAHHIQIHTAGAFHKAKYDAVCSSHMIFEHGDNFVCGVCGCYIPYGAELDHVAGKRHERNSEYATFDTSEDYCTLCNVTNFGTSNVGEHVTGVQHKANLTSKQTGQIHCDICDLTLTFNNNNIKVHNDGAQHKNNCDLFQQHKIVVKKSVCCCEICGVCFPRATVDEHISGFNHMVRLHGEQS